jgi:hypothetical protein
LQDFFIIIVHMIFSILKIIPLSLFCFLFFGVFKSCVKKNKVTAEIEIVDINTNAISLQKAINTLRKRFQYAGYSFETEIVNKRNVKITTNFTDSLLLTDLIESRGVLKAIESASYELIKSALAKADVKMNTFLHDTPYHPMKAILQQKINYSNSPASLLLNKFGGSYNEPLAPCFGVVFKSDSVFFSLLDSVFNSCLPDGFEIMKQYNKEIDGLNLFAANKKGGVLILNEYTQKLQVDETEANEYSVTLQFNGAGAARLKRFTEKMHQKHVLMLLDKKVLTVPIVTDIIENGHLQIRGFASKNEAQTFFAMLKAGLLPLRLRVNSLRVLK